MKYKAAVIGCGRIGFTFDNDAKRRYVASHAKAYKSVKNTELAAVCDIDSGKLQKCRKELNIPAGYADLKKMLTKEKIDILSICTPPATHYGIIKEAAKFPLRAIFCEKPLADNLEDAKKILDLCAGKKMILQVGHQRRFDRLHLQTKELMRNGRLGKAQQVNFYYTAGVKNTGSHMFDILRFFFGNVKWIEAVFSENKSGNKKDPNVDGVLKFRNGLFATFQACDVKNYLVFEMNCFLNKGRFILKESGWSLDFYKVKDSTYCSGYKELHKVKSPFNISYKRNFMINAVKHLTECIRENKEPVSSGKDGLAAVELIRAALTSAKNNGKRIFLAE